MTAEFDSSELDFYRQEIINQLIDDFRITHVQVGKDDTGGQTEVTTTSDVKGLIGPTGDAKQIQLASSLRIGKPYTVTLPFGTNIAESDRILDLTHGHTFEVKSVISDYSYSIAVTALCERE